MSASGTLRRLPGGPVVLDASFLLALLDGEDAAQRFAPVLAHGVVPAVTAGETFYKLHAAAGIDPAQVEDGLIALGIELVDLPVAAARHFPALKALDARRREEQRAAGDKPVQTLSLGDLCCLGYAGHARLPLLTGDRPLGQQPATARARRGCLRLPRPRQRTLTVVSAPCGHRVARTRPGEVATLLTRRLP